MSAKRKSSKATYKKPQDVHVPETKENEPVTGSTIEPVVESPVSEVLLSATDATINGFICTAIECAEGVRGLFDSEDKALGLVTARGIAYSKVVSACNSLKKARDTLIKGV